MTRPSQPVLSMLVGYAATDSLAMRSYRGGSESSEWDRGQNSHVRLPTPAETHVFDTPIGQR
jgi:hypothetical protein